MAPSVLPVSNLPPSLQRVDAEAVFPRSSFLEPGLGMRLRDDSGTPLPARCADGRNVRPQAVRILAPTDRGRQPSCPGRTGPKASKAWTDTSVSARFATPLSAAPDAETADAQVCASIGAAEFPKVVEVADHGHRLLDVADQRHAELVQHMWHYLSRQIRDLHCDLAAVRGELSTLQRSNAECRAWQEATVPSQLQTLRDDLVSSREGLQLELGNLNEELRRANLREQEEREAGLRHLDERLQPELRSMRARHEEHAADFKKLQERLDAMGDISRGLERSIGQLAGEDRERCSRLEHHLATSMGKLDVHVQEELSRLSQELFRHCRERNALLQDDSRRAEAVMRRDFTALSQNQQKEMLAHESWRDSVNPSFEDVDTRIQATLDKASEESRRASESLRSDLQGQLDTMRAALERLTVEMGDELHELCQEHDKEAMILGNQVRTLQRQAAEANKESAKLKGCLSEILAVPVISKSLR